MKLKKIISLLLCGIMFFTCSNFSAFALTANEIQAEIDKLEQQQQSIKNEINSLKKDKAKQTELKNAIERQIAVTQQQINICNSQISKNNAAIADNEAEIAKMNEKIDEATFKYKKRIRAIYMGSSSGSGIEILLGAETFADYIALSQATLNISRRDKRMIDDIVVLIEAIEEKMKDNLVIIEQQKAIKQTLAGKQAELDKQVAEVQKVINSISSDISNETAENAQIQKEIDEWNKKMEELSRPPIDTSPFDGIFAWPVPGFTNRTSEYGPRWNKKHAGIDIAQGGIANAKVVAIASGTVTVWCSSCNHNYGKVSSSGKVYSCGCGGGYGNYLSIDHGTYNGASFRSVYAHLAPGSITVRSGQKVGKGQIIGKVGTTGRSTGYHLHFEIRKNGIAVNPMNYY